MSSMVNPMARASGAERPNSLDIETLDRNTMSDASLQKELFELYFGQSSAYLNTMTEALSAQDKQAWGAAAHSLKGTARTLGLMWLATATAAAEASAPSHRLLSEIEDAIVDAQAAAAGYLAQTAVAS